MITNQERPALVGRTHVVASVLSLVRQSRLLTITGTGGVGKTCLAREVSTELETEYDRVEFVDMTGTSSLHAAERLTKRDDMGYAALEVSPTLIVLDNCEYDADRIADWVAGILANTTMTTVIVTSRRPIYVAEERLYPLQPLSIPSGEESASELLVFEAVQLFVERSVQANPLFELTDKNAAAVSEICSLTNGLPIVIELAAGLTRSRPLDAIVTAMRTAEDLETRRRDVHPHQQSLTKSITWSLGLLSEQSLRVLQCAAKFAGPFTMGSVEHIHAAIGGADTDASLDELVEHSLVQFDIDLGRFLVLDLVANTVRSGTDAETEITISDAYIAWAYDLSSEIASRVFVADHDGSFPDFRHSLRDLEVVAAEVWDADNTVRWLELMGPIAPWWLHHGGVVDIERWQAVVDSAEVSSAAADLSLGLAFRFGHMGDHDRALQSANVALDCAKQLDDTNLMVAAWSVMGSAQRSLGDLPRASETYRRALELNADGVAPYLLGMIWVGVAETSESVADRRSFLQKARMLSVDDFPAIFIAASQSLARLELQERNIDEAVAHVESSLIRAEKIGFDEAIGTLHNISGMLAIERTQLAEAEQCFRRSIAVGRRIGHMGVIGEGLSGLAEICYQYGSSEVAANVAAQALLVDDSLDLSTELNRIVKPTEPVGRRTIREILGSLPSPLIEVPEQNYSDDEVLTPRENSVLRLLRGDLTQREIADELYISVSTVRTHVKSLYRKLGVHSRSGCVHEATVRGLLPSPNGYDQHR